MESATVLTLFSNSSITNTVRGMGFLSALLLILIAFLATSYALYFDRKMAVKTSIMLYDRLEQSPRCDASMMEYLKTYSLKRLEEPEAMKIFEKAKPVIEDKDIRDTFQSGNIQVYMYDDYYYYGYMAGGGMYYFKSVDKMKPYWLYISALIFGMFVLLYFLNRFVTRSITPLKTLHEKIESFAKGENVEAIHIKGNDEVATVANAFNDAAQSISDLQRSRILFMRNIMHELKTPIMQGKLMAYMMETSCGDKDKLLSTFERMEAQLTDLANVEAMTSNTTTIDAKRYALIDIFENVCDILDLDERNIKHNINNESVNVDFNLFSTALKNLIDNAFKYASALPIELRIEGKDILIINEGNPLDSDIENYLTPFSRDKSAVGTEGFGLGLYITKEILKRHHSDLEYKYLMESHCFRLKSVCL